MYIDPRPTPASIGTVYENYYTHHGEGSGEHQPSGLRARLLDGYLHRHFGYTAARSSALGVLVVTIVPGARAMASQHVRHLHAPGPDGGRLLDIGCAGGGFLVRMQALGWQVAGVEPDPESRAIATARGLQVFETLDALAATDDPAFDAITLSHSIEHMHDPAGELRRCRAFLKPGGMLWVATPNAAAAGHRRYGRAWAPLDPPRHLVLFTPSSLAAAFQRAGFTSVEWPPATLQASAWTYRMSVALRNADDEASPRPLPWRDKLAAAWADVRTAVGRVSGEEVVIVGRNGAGEGE